MSAPSVEAYLKRSIAQFVVPGLAVAALISIAIAFGLARLKTATNLENIAVASVNAFHDQIVDGDARGAEVQIQKMLQLAPSESAWLLRPDRSRFYQPADLASLTVQACRSAGVTCMTWPFGSAKILEPIYYGNDRDHLFGYLFIERQVHIDWEFLITAFLVSASAAVGMILLMLKLIRGGVDRMATELSHWSSRLKNDPKSAEPMSPPPFAELLGLKEAIEGLREKIEVLEKEAGHKARLLLLRGIAHDILTPVSQLQLRIATLEIKLRGTAHQASLEPVRASLQQIAGIASQVKLLKDELPPPDGTNLVTAIQSEIELLKQTDAVLSKGIDLEVKACEGPITTPFTKVEITRIIGNLVGNAAHASKTGSQINIEIGEEDGLVSLKVRDQGCGVPTIYHSKVFDPDFTLKPGTGTGLGLAIVQYLCDQRKATVDFLSVENQGTTVTIKVAPLAV